MRFRQKTLKEIAEHIVRLGLAKCPVCGSESSLGASPYPVLLSFGGFHHEPRDPRHDPEANVWFAVNVECQVCGHMMLFNSERFHHGNEPVLFQGSIELEQEMDPPDDE